MQHRDNITELKGSEASILTEDYGNPWKSGLSRFFVKQIMRGEICLLQDDVGRSIQATCSASCLLQPLAGDEVLVYLDHTIKEYFVLAVLKRAAHNPRLYSLSEDVNLVTHNGHLHIAANAIELTAAQGKFNIDRFEGVYKDKSEKADTITTVANLVRHQIDRVISRIRNSFRLIEGLDRTQAVNIQQTAEHQILLRSDFTKLSSEHVVKVEARKIDLG